MNGYTDNRGHRIRQEMLDALNLYVNEGHYLGDFLTAIIAHNFIEAIGRADTDNYNNIQAYAMWLYNEPPAACHGSMQAYHNWIDMHAKRRQQEGGE